MTNLSYISTLSVFHKLNFLLNALLFEKYKILYLHHFIDKFNYFKYTSLFLYFYLILLHNFIL